ncbi:MAG: hypothetical protein CMA65_04500 [Euryarchaeota archaeon]|jgi:hypothetical protein|nr:hypothetical protein [Euryarchaeota archaeon]
MSSIFINKERGEYFKGYWFGFLIPILIGFSLNVTILFLLINYDLSFDSYLGIRITLLEYIFIAIFYGGPLIVWPFSSWWLIRRADKLEKLSQKNGAWLSIKFYIIGVVYFVFAAIINTALGGGE